MSRTFNLACLSCRKALWIAQRGTSGDLIVYYDDRDVRLDLANFLTEHENHPLSFVDDERMDDDIVEINRGPTDE